VTTSVKTSIPDVQPVRKILAWLDDDDDRRTPADEVVEIAPRADQAFAEGVLVVAPAAASDVSISQSPPVESLGVLVPVVPAHGHYKIREYGDAVRTGLWAKHIVARGLKTFGTAGMSPAWTTTGVEPDWVFMSPAIAALVGHHDFYSSALPELAQIELTIESINQTMRDSMRKFVSAYVRDRGHAYYGAADDHFESAGLAYTDHLGDYPPLTRVYEDVEVVMGTEDEIERPVYTDEDYQVWGT
jgi:hypothetical protein